MKKTGSYGLFRFIRGAVKLFYPEIKAEGRENLPDEPCIIVANHCQMNGPIVCELYPPCPCYTWCAGEMMELKEVPAYAYKDFWSEKPKYIRWFYKLLSYIIAPLAACIFNNAKTIAVYRDIRLRNTFKETMDRLDEGESSVVFPEHAVERNNIVYDFQDKFIDVARMYYKRSGKELCFVPMYIAPKLKKLYIGNPVRFNSQAPIKEERQRICEYLMDEITAIARALPEHTVVPYKNLPKRLYPKNSYTEERTNEEASC